MAFKLLPLFLIMHKQKENQVLLKTKKVNTRLHTGPIPNTYEPNNENAKAGFFYRSGIAWNALGVKYRTMDFVSFKTYQRQQLMSYFLDK